MLEIQRPLDPEMEELIIATDENVGFTGALAIHSTLRGPALCNTRFYPYASLEAAMEDAKRLARVVTYGAATANIPFGGASCAIIEPEKPDYDRAAIFTAFGKMIDELEGRIIAAKDLGSSMSDMNTVKKVTPFASGGSSGGPGDPAFFTALGVLRGIEAAVRTIWKTDSLEDLVISVMGIGHVGFHLCEMLSLTGARIYATDITAANVEMAVNQFNAKAVRPRLMMETPCDIIVPCALGGILNDTTIPKLQCKLIAGPASNQMQQPERHGHMLAKREIIWVPDFAINAGGLYTFAGEINGYDSAKTTVLVNGIYDTVIRILRQSAQCGMSSYDVAMGIALDKLRRTNAKRILQHI